MSGEKSSNIISSDDKSPVQKKLRLLYGTVNVDQEEANITFSKIATQSISSCHVILIDGQYKDDAFAYLSHSSRDYEPLSTLTTEEALSEIIKHIVDKIADYNKLNQEEQLNILKTKINTVLVAGGNCEYLQKYGHDLIADAHEEKLRRPNFFGYHSAIKRIIDALFEKHNCILINHPYVSSLTIIEDLAKCIYHKLNSVKTLPKRLIVLNMEELNADIANRGEFEKRLKLFLKQIRTADGGIIIFIDDIHLILGGEGVNDAANLLKFMLSQHEICCIGATTLDEYDKHFEQDPVLKKHFQEVFIEELTVAESVNILRDGLKRSMEPHFRFPILDSAIVSAVELSNHFIIYKYLPYEAIDTIYGACRNIFRARMDSSSNIIDRSKHEELSSDVTETTSSKEKDDTSTEEHTSENGDASEKEDTATKDDTSEIDLTEVKEKSKTFTLKHEIPKGVDSTVIIDIFSKLTDIPVSTLTEAENNRLSIIREDLHNRFIDQDAAIDTVVETILRNRAEFPVKNRPLASFLFCGK
ncbi:unnamed protein product [Rotaria sp. Silwood2]|nr:unnamed protein product [Rotaria sp. Silwood2]CAF4417057.1 unnamed protein product [Rotaria sp. Silwood2]